jgi:hypothetical protein
MEVVLEGPLVPKVAKNCGLRDARRRPWAKDPEEAKRLEAMADRFLSAWTPMLLEGCADDGWFCAMVAARRVDEEVGANVVLVANRDGSGTRILTLGRDQYPMDGTRTEEGVRREITRVFADPPSDEVEPGRIWQPSSQHNLSEAASEAGVKRFASTSRDFRKRLEVCWSKVRNTALARFRRLLPPEIQEHASLCLAKFADLRTAGEFLHERRGWTLQDYGRVNQAIRLVPVLRNAILDPEVFRPIAEGRPLHEVVSAAVEADSGLAPRPLHSKTVKALRGTWHGSFRTNWRKGDLTSLVQVLEAMYRRNPHQPVFGSGELAQVDAIANLDPVELDLTVDAIMAHRDAKGRVRPCRDIRDTYGWIYQQCEMILTGSEAYASENEKISATKAAFRILFPSGRTLAGLDALVQEWHRDQRRLDAAFHHTFESMLAAKFDAARRKVGDILFPHFMDGECTIEGVTMRPLTDPDEIVVEGEEMEHCVGTYVGRASGGRSLLISQRSEQGRSTAEVALVKSDNGTVNMVVRQNRAVANGEPPEVHHRALTKLLNFFPQDMRRQLMERIEVASALADRHAGQAYSSLDPDDLLRLKQLAFDNMRRFMPRRMRRMTMEEWIAEMAPAAPTNDAGVPEEASRLEAAE